MKHIDLSKSIPREAKILSVTPNNMEVLLNETGGGIMLDGVTKTEYRYIAGSIEILEDHAVPLTFRFFIPGMAEERAHYRFVLIPRIKTRICFDLTAIDCQSGVLRNRTPGLLKAVVHGARTDLGDVSNVEIGSKPIFHAVHIRLEDFFLTNEEVRDFPLPDVKLVDEFGQWKGKEWPGKIHSREDLAVAMYSNEGPAEYPFPDWNKWGGDSNRRLTKGTGFFTTYKTHDGRWHLVDPDGCDFFSMGVCSVNPGDPGNITSMEKTLEWLPDADDPEYGTFMHTRNITWLSDKPIKLFNFCRANLYKVYGDAWEEKWKKITYHILMGCGVNSQGNFSSLDLGNGNTRIPYVVQLPDFPATQIMIVRDFPDVLSPEYERNSQLYAQKLTKTKDDPWLIGYFLRNEPGFNFIRNISIANEVLHNPEMTYCRAAFIGFLKNRYGTVERLNMVWGADFLSFADLEKPFKDCSAEYPLSQTDLREYSLYLLREYNRIPSQACRKVDPRHLNLGMRWSNLHNPDMLAGWEYLDVFSFNCYALDPLQDMDFVREAGVDRPIMIGEYHCGALDRGLTATGLKGVENQYERGVMWRQFVEKCAAHPLGVGAHWFEYNDEFILGRFDGENYQIGIVDICMQPYRELTNAARETASVLYSVRNGECRPYMQAPKVIPMIG